MAQQFVCSLAPFQVVEGVGTDSVSGSCPRLVPFEAADSVASFIHVGFQVRSLTVQFRL
jgi:hypothetical protein